MCVGDVDGEDQSKCNVNLNVEWEVKSNNIVCFKFCEEEFEPTAETSIYFFNFFFVNWGESELTAIGLAVLDGTHGGDFFFVFFL